MKIKSIILVLILIASSVSLYGIPSNLTGDEEGWFELNIGYTLTIPVMATEKFGHNLRGGFVWSMNNIGLGAGFMAGEDYANCYAEGHYYFDVPGMDSLNIPVFIKAGFFQSGILGWLGLSAETGLKYFFDEKVEDIGPSLEYYYKSLELLSEMDFLIIPLFDTASRELKTADRFIFSASAVYSFDTTPRPSSGVYYY